MQNFKTSDLDASNSPQVNPSPVVEAELPTPVVAQVVRRKSRLTIRGIVGWCWRTFKSIVEALFGMLSLIVLLSVAATIPILQFLSLGYLLEAAARIARDGGRIRDGFVGIRQAARIGGAALGTWFLLQPLRFVIDLRREAVLFRDSQLTEGGWNVAFAATAFLIVGQIVWALFRGGRLRSFFWPAPWKLVRRIRQGMFGTGGMYQQARDGLSDFVTQMNLQHYFWLGLRGFVVAVTWLALPVSMFVLASRLPSNGIAVLLSLLLIVGQIVRVRIRGGRWPNFRRSAPVKLRHLIWWGIRGLWVTFTWVVLPFLVFVLVSNSPHEIASLWMSLLGGLLLSIVVLYLPYLQINFAADDNVAAGFDVGRVRDQFRHAPIAFGASLLVTLALALPLYILKAELIPREAAWLPSIVFVISILPARLLTGWALSRARRKDKPSFFLFRWTARLGGLPIVLIYALFVYITQFTSWYGAWSLYEQHAFLLPVPFLGV